jgi:hypothetical protein
VSPGRKRLGRAYRAAVAAEPLVRPVPFSAYVRAVARGLVAELYPGHRKDARRWCLRKWAKPRAYPPWGKYVPACPCCKSAPCDKSRLGCRTQPKADVAGQLQRERDAAHDALREILSFALGAEVPTEAAIEPQAVVRQVRMSLGAR